MATEVTKDTEQAFTADLKPYFDAMGNDQRLIWNDEYAGLAYYREVKWVYEDPQTGKTMEKILTYLAMLWQSILKVKRQAKLRK